jgi:small subunit ribosomal protein S2
MSISMKDLLQAGVHFGHRTQRWNPKMKHYLYGKRNGIHIFDLEQTANKLNEALAFLYDQVSIGKTVMFVSTKNQTADILPNAAKEANCPYMANRWPGGFLTNYPTIKKRIQYLLSLEENKESGELTKKYTKKEALMFERDIIKLNEVLVGVKTLKGLPDVIFVADAVRDQLAIVEAHKMKIPVVAICDSNSDPELVDYVIPANDDALRSLALIIQAVSGAIQEGRKAYVPPRAAESKPAAPRPNAKPIENIQISQEAMAEKDKGEAPAAKPRTAKKPAVKAAQ